eukprot:TRINITY_DN96671_c0_g1_i1.p2 TRINITY_DN96671_c0_g1~~TRINITY_DN96671_c0_g1_i1.p2  ORF type:complete len:199 (-),score=16.53 TRINITY_DN96671_c0_g1_i1:649-1245(-)
MHHDYRKNKTILLVDKKKSLFDIQIEFIFEEYRMLQREIAELNKKSQNCRNWTITLWAGSIALFVNHSGANSPEYIWLSAIFPFMFWLQDTRFTQIQRAFIYRSKAISDFFSSEDFEYSKKKGKVSGLSISGFRKSTKIELFNDPEYKDFVSFWKVFFFPTKQSFYPVFVSSSIFLHVFFNKLVNISEKWAKIEEYLK